MEIDKSDKSNNTKNIVKTDNITNINNINNANSKNIISNMEQKPNKCNVLTEFNHVNIGQSQNYSEDKRATSLSLNRSNRYTSNRSNNELEAVLDLKSTLEHKLETVLESNLYKPIKISLKRQQSEDASHPLSSRQPDSLVEIRESHDRLNNMTDPETCFTRSKNDNSKDFNYCSLEQSYHKDNISTPPHQNTLNSGLGCGYSYNKDINSYFDNTNRFLVKKPKSEDNQRHVFTNTINNELAWKTYGIYYGDTVIENSTDNYMINHNNINKVDNGYYTDGYGSNLMRNGYNNKVIPCITPSNSKSLSEDYWSNRQEILTEKEPDIMFNNHMIPEMNPLDCSNQFVYHTGRLEHYIPQNVPTKYSNSFIPEDYNGDIVNKQAFGYSPYNPSYWNNEAGYNTINDNKAICHNYNTGSIAINNERDPIHRHNGKHLSERKAREDMASEQYSEEYTTDESDITYTRNKNNKKDKIRTSASNQVLLPNNTGKSIESIMTCIHTEYECLELITKAKKQEIHQVTKRLTEMEKRNIKPGAVFIYNEKTSEIKRWTDNKMWSPSRVSGPFLTYRETEGCFYKKTYTSKVGNEMFHLVAYSLMEWENKGMQIGHCCNKFRSQEKVNNKSKWGKETKNKEQKMRWEKIKHSRNEKEENKKKGERKRLKKEQAITRRSLIKGNIYQEGSSGEDDSKQETLPGHTTELTLSEGLTFGRKISNMQSTAAPQAPSSPTAEASTRKDENQNESTGDRQVLLNLRVDDMNEYTKEIFTSRK